MSDSLVLFLDSYSIWEIGDLSPQDHLETVNFFALSRLRIAHSLHVPVPQTLLNPTGFVQLTGSKPSILFLSSYNSFDSRPGADLQPIIVQFTNASGPKYECVPSLTASV